MTTRSDTIYLGLGSWRRGRATFGRGIDVRCRGERTTPCHVNRHNDRGRLNAPTTIGRICECDCKLRESASKRRHLRLTQDSLSQSSSNSLASLVLFNYKNPTKQLKFGIVFKSSQIGIFVYNLAMRWTAVLLLTLSWCSQLVDSHSLRNTAVAKVGNSTTNNVLIVYYSFTKGGCTERMADEVAIGAAAANATVRVQRVNETSCDDVKWADALIVGSPVHFANPASDVIAFFEYVQDECFGWPLTALELKVGGVFVDGGGEDKGKDPTMQSIQGAMLSMRFVVRGCNEGTCNAWGATATNLDHPGKPAPPLTDDEVAASQDLGKKIAELSDLIWHS